jgi:uncharacterized protein (DUF2235 family)
MVLISVQAGVGTYSPPGLVSPISTWLAQTLDKGVAWFLYQHVMDGYKFLMQNYNVGDKVCLFGGLFSSCVNTTYLVWYHGKVSREVHILPEPLRGCCTK